MHTYIFKLLAFSFLSFSFNAFTYLHKHMDRHLGCFLFFGYYKVYSSGRVFRLFRVEETKSSGGHDRT